MVTSITGAGATWQAAAFGATNNGTSVRCEVWYGINPASGAQTVVVNFGALGASHDVTAGVYSYYDANLAAPLANYVTRTTVGDLLVDGPTGSASIAGRSSFSNATISGCTSVKDADLGFNAGQEAAHCFLPTGGSYFITSFPGTRNIILQRR